MDIHCNAGVTTTYLVVDLPGYGTVWYHPEVIANILSLARVKEKCSVTYNSVDGNSFVVTKPDGRTHRFQQSPSGLYYVDARTMTRPHVTLVNTVAENKTQYSKSDYQRAVAARRLQHILGFPSTRTLIEIVESGQLPNCPITKSDILAAEDIFGPDISILKGKPPAVPLIASRCASLKSHLTSLLVTGMSL
jgi:hypothetical protein